MRLPLPREHGTWAMMYVPMICAAATLRTFNVEFMLFAVSATAFFFLREPFEAFVRIKLLKVSDPERLHHLIQWCLVYGTIGMISGSVLIYKGYLLLILFGLLFIVVLLIHILLSLRRKDRQVISEFLAVVGLTSSGPAASYVLSGFFNLDAWLLWCLMTLYFSSSVFYVKMRVARQAKKKEASTATTSNIIYHVLLGIITGFLAAVKVVSWIAWAAFLPIIVRAFTGWNQTGKLNLTRIGIAEVIYTIVFTLLIAIGL